MPGSPDNSKDPFLRIFSLVFLIVSLVIAAWTIFVNTTFLIPGFWSNQVDNLSLIIDSTINLTSDDTSLSFVCDENLGSGILIDKTPVRPSLVSSPVSVILFFLKD